MPLDIRSSFCHTVLNSALSYSCNPLRERVEFLWWNWMSTFVPITLQRFIFAFGKTRVTLTLTNCFAIHLPLKDQILFNMTSCMDVPWLFLWFFQALDFLKTREEFWNQLQLGSSISVPAVDAKSKNQRSKKRWFGTVHKWCHNLGYIIIKLIFKDLTKKYGHFLKK